MSHPQSYIDVQPDGSRRFPTERTEFDRVWDALASVYSGATEVEARALLDALADRELLLVPRGHEPIDQEEDK